MWILGQVVFGQHVKVGKVAAATAGHQYFFADFVGVVNYHDLPASIASRCRAHQTGSAGTDN